MRLSHERQIQILREALAEYRDAVRKGLRADRVDGCWQRAILAMQFLFTPSEVRRAKADLKKNPLDR